MLITIILISILIGSVIGYIISEFINPFFPIDYFAVTRLILSLFASLTVFLLLWLTVKKWPKGEYFRTIAAVLIMIINLVISLLFLVSGIFGLGITCGSSGDTYSFRCTYGTLLTFIPLAVSIVALAFLLFGRNKKFKYLFWFFSVTNLLTIAVFIVFK